MFTADGHRLAASRNLLLCPGDEVQTGATGRVAIRFDEKRTVVRLDGNSRMRVLAGGTGTADVSLVSGLLYFLSSVRRHFEVDTPYIVAGISGTEALVSVEPTNAMAIAAVREGTVRAYDHQSPERGALAVGGGEAAFRSASVPFQSAPIGSLPPAFRSLLIVSDSAVDWAIYYPPIMLASDTKNRGVRKALVLLSSGEYDRAEAALDRARAAPSETAALRTIVAVARNRIVEAEQWSAVALAADAEAAPANIAASYLRQAVGDLNAALAFALRAQRNAPRNPYAAARVAELEMTIGEHRAALAAANQSLAIQRIPLALFVAGLVELSRWRYGEAEALFKEGIALDPEEPLPRLGLGLAYIRQGRTAAGTWEIERAVAHDPTRASLRTWLGRAYFDEELKVKAIEELGLAKQADPQDPTPYLFSALQLYDENRPIKALGELENAEEHAGARSVVRSHEGLYEDAATRGAALGRIYDVLGFQQMALNEGARAAEQDPGSPAAHRFLADAYRTRPAEQAGQTSELLRAELLSPPSKTPVQPQIAETGLGLLDTSGTTRVTFAEFSPLFDADGVRLDATGALGTQATRAGEASLTMLYRGFSLSVGGFHYETDGYHPNNDVDHGVVDAVTTVALNDWLSLFGEYRWRNTESGDRSIVFDPASLSNVRIGFEREVARVGFHAAPAVGQDVLGLFSHATLDTTTSEFLSPFTTTSDTGEAIDEGQVQYIGEVGSGHLQLGGSLSHVDGHETTGLLVGNFGAFSESPVDVDQANGYGYATFSFPDQVDWTLGMSLDHIDDEEDFTRTELNPKLGIRVRLTDGLAIRGAFIRTLKRRLVADQTLEPTTVAGFPQFLDTFNGTEGERFGLGGDVQLAPNLWAGIEATRDEWNLATDTGNDVNEERIAGYLNATFGDFALSFSPSREWLRSDALFVLDRLDTTELPLTASYFWAGGGFGSVKGTFVHQSGEDDPVSFHDNFFVLDASVGFRFPNQRGVVSLEARNILDDHFDFAEQRLVDDLTSEPRYAPERTLIGRLTLRF